MIVVIAFGIICGGVFFCCNHCEHNVIITTYTLHDTTACVRDFTRPECLHLLVIMIATQGLAVVEGQRKFSTTLVLYRVTKGKLSESLIKDHVKQLCPNLWVHC